MEISEIVDNAHRTTTGTDLVAERKRFRSDIPPHVPAIILSPEGSIVDITLPARRILEYRTDQPIESGFFSLVHARNLYQIMRDIADMVCHGKQRAGWLLRLHTGQKRWRWYKATVENRLNEEDGHILVFLRDVNDL